MKKVLSVLLAVLLLTPFFVQATGANSSVQLLELLLNKLERETDSYPSLFDPDTCFVYVDDEGDVIVSLTTVVPTSLFKANEDAVITFLSQMYQGFMILHSEVSTVGLYLSVFYDFEPLYFVSENSIMDCTTYETFEHDVGDAT